MADIQAQRAPEAQQVTVDDLSKKIRETTNELNQLKNGLSNLSAEELQQKADELSDIEQTISECMDDLSSLEKDGSASISRSQLDALRSQINTLTTSKDAVQAQIESQTRAKLDSLKGNIAQTQNNGESKEGDNQQGEKKGLKGWWNGLNKGQKWGVRIGGALAGLGILKLGRRIFGEKYNYESEIPGYSSMSRKQRRIERKKLKQRKRAERRSERRAGRGEFRDRPFGKFVKGTGIFLGVGSGVYYLAHGIYTKNRGLNDLFDWEKGKKLSFEDAMNAAAGNIANQENNDSMSHDINLYYDDSTSEISAYGERVKIDKKNRKIDGLNINFKKYEHMISAAILIAFLKKEYSGKCPNNTPFSTGSEGRGNANVNTGDSSQVALDGTGNIGKKIAMNVAGIGGLLTLIFSGSLKASLAVGGVAAIIGGQVGGAYDKDNMANNYMPEIDKDGMGVLVGYLNGLGCWEQRNQSIDEITDSPIKQEVRDVIKKLQNDNVEGKADGGLRKMDAIQDKNNPTKYTIKAYDREREVKVDNNNGSKTLKLLGIKNVGTPKLKIDLEKGNMRDKEFSLKEGLYMIELTSSLLKNYNNKGYNYPRFRYGSKTIVPVGTYFGIRERALYFQDSGTWDSKILGEKEFKERMPTVFNDLKDPNSGFLSFLNDGIMKENNISVWKNPDLNN